MPRRLNPSPTPPPVQRAVREIGMHLADWRRLQALTSEQVADRAGISPATLSKLEQGGGCSLENALRVARVLGVMQQIVAATDPASSDVGRLRSHDILPQRVRQPRRADS